MHDLQLCVANFEEGLYTVSRCRTRDESEDHTSEKACKKKGPTLALKPGTDVTKIIQINKKTLKKVQLLRILDKNRVCLF